MATFYLDYENGSDAGTGADWANAWKTITSGATAARIAPGDVIRIAKSPDPSSIGNATWTNCQTGGGFPATKNIGSSTNASPIVVTINSHGYSNGDVIQIIGHTSNASANGAWVIANVSTNTFELVGSVGVGTGGANGTAQKINSKAVVLATAQTADIDRCEIAWTANGSGDTTVALTAVGTDAKEGGNCMKLTLDASPQTSTLQAYKTISSTDFSAYQRISFWIKNSAAIANATTWKVCLCSDTAGATPVDTFYIPAIPSTNQWLPLTLTKDGGGNLGSAIQSVAIYTSSSSPTNSSYIYVDNFIACTTSGLNLQSLISKNSLAQGGDEGWYGIQSINGVNVLLDNEPNCKANAGRGYSTTGTSPETVTTYKRETIKTALVSSSTTSVQEIQDVGSAGNNIEYQGGYNTSTSSQDGETFFDGLNGFGYGLRLNNKHYSTINLLNFYRYYYGFFTESSSTENTITVSTANNSNTGIYISGSSTKNTATVSNANNNNSHGVYISSSTKNTATVSNANNNSQQGLNLSGASLNTATVSNANNNYYNGVNLTSSSYCNTIVSISNVNNNNYGVSIDSGNNNVIKLISNSNNNRNYGVNFAASFNNVINNLSTSGNSTGGIYSTAGKNFLKNTSIAEATEVAGFTDYANSRVYSLKHDNTANNNWTFTDYGTISSTTNDRSGGAGLKWKYTISSYKRDSNYPLDMVLMEIPVVADAAVTVTAYCMKDHATNVGAKLVCRGGQLAGVASDVVDTKADDTDWEQLSISFTPTESGVIEIEGWGYYVAGNSNVYFADVTATQA